MDRGVRPAGDRMSARFFVDGQLKSGNLACTGAEFHHMIRVTRHRIGDTVRLFDGTGREADAMIEAVSRHAVNLKVASIERIPEDPGPHLVLVAAMPKGSRGTTLVEKAVELGVSGIIPIRTDRSVVDPRQSRLENLRQTVIAASKQCGRSRLMDVADVIDWSEFVGTQLTDGRTLIAHPGGAPLKEGLIQEMLNESGRQASSGDADRPLIAVVGPEGGFTVEEISQAVSHGARLVSLGPRILRVETAAMMVASVFSAASMRA